MSYLGKEYKCVKHENYAGFLKSLGISDEKVQEFLTFDLKEKVIKDGDMYTFFYSSPLGEQKVTFRPGVECDEPVEGFKLKSTYKIDGDTIQQVTRSKDVVATFKREYNGSDLVITLTSDNWDGVARTYYKAL